MRSKGDPRVHLLMNLILSAVFMYVVVWGLDFIGAMEFTLPRYVVGTLLLVMITHVLVD